MQLSVLVLEDEPEVREAILRDLADLAATVRLEPAEDVADARAVLEEIDRDGDVLALVLADHRLPGASGVDLLVALCDDRVHRGARKVLVTGQADQQDTVRAVNEAGLDHFVTKPWDPGQLQALVRAQLTAFVVEQGYDPLPHLRALDAAAVMPLLRGGGDR